MFFPDLGSVRPETPMKIPRPAKFLFRFPGIKGIFFVAGKSGCSPLLKGGPGRKTSRTIRAESLR
jgi:hypothetical protein